MTGILKGFAFLCKLGLLLFKPHWDYQIKTKRILVVVVKWRHRANGLLRNLIIPPGNSYSPQLAILGQVVTVPLVICLVCMCYIHRHTGNFLPGGGSKPFAQKHLASCPNCYERVKKKWGPYCSNIGRPGIWRWLDTVFQGQYQVWA